jgi:hypothetical protein
MKRKHLTETPVCPREHLIIISYTTGLSFALERIGPLTAIIITVFYLHYQIPLKTCLLVFTVNLWSKLLVNTFCSSLGSTLLFIESTTIHPLYLWVITAYHDQDHRCVILHVVCWDLINIDTMSSWFAKLLSLCYLYVVYDLACSPLLVDILAE